jgi:hypothetical protein
MHFWYAALLPCENASDALNNQPPGLSHSHKRVEDVRFNLLERTLLLLRIGGRNQ